MSKYIKADDLFKWYKGQRTKYPIKGDSPQFGTLMMYEIFDEIEDALSIDIVHCRECKHEHVCSWSNSGFCGFGEREGERWT